LNHYLNLYVLYVLYKRSPKRTYRFLKRTVWFPPIAESKAQLVRIGHLLFHNLRFAILSTKQDDQGQAGVDIDCESVGHTTTESLLCRTDQL